MSLHIQFAIPPSNQFNDLVRESFDQVVMLKICLVSLVRPIARPTPLAPLIFIRINSLRDPRYSTCQLNAFEISIKINYKQYHINNALVDLLIDHYIYQAPDIIQAIQLSSLLMQAFPTLHSIKLHFDTPEKLQNFFNLRKTHYSMRFNRSRNEKIVLEEQNQFNEANGFPIIVNNRIRSFRSEKVVKFVEEDEAECRDMMNDSKVKSRAKRLVRQLSHDKSNPQERDSNAMFETIKIRKVSLAHKKTELFRKTELNFKNNHSLNRRQIVHKAHKESKTSRTVIKKEILCGWETSISQFY